MEEFINFLNAKSQSSDFSALLSPRGGYITFSNSGRRGEKKYFSLGLDSLLTTLKDIKLNINNFVAIQNYDETQWRNNGSLYFSDNVVNATSTVQTKPLFATLSKIIVWANVPDLDNVDTDSQMPINEVYLDNAISKLESICELFSPSKCQAEQIIINSIKNHTSEELVDILKKIKASGVSYPLHIFGFKYGEYCKEHGINISDISLKAGFSDSMASAEWQKGAGIAKVISKGMFGMKFYDPDERYKDTLKSSKSNTFLQQIHSGAPVEPTSKKPNFDSQDYLYMSAIKTKPFLILGGFSGTGKSLLVKRLAFATCPCDGTLNLSETTPGNYLLVSVKPNWHDATDITGFRSSVNRNYYVTDFLRFLVKAKKYENQKVPFFVCLDEMNLAPVEEYFAEFLSVIESRKRTNDGRIVTDSIVSASVFNAKDYADDFNIFLSLGLTPLEEVKDITEFTAHIKENGNESEYFEESWLVDELKKEGLTIPSNVIIVGTVNMDDTTNSFSRKVIDRAMTFETVIGEFGDSYFDDDVALNYVKNPFKGELFISDEVRATEMLDKERFSLEDEKKKEILDFINNINEDLEGSPFKISYRILNETILLYRSKIEIEKIIKEDGGFENGIKFNTDLNSIFDDILMQKILPRIEGDYDKCNKCLESLRTRAYSNGWSKSEEKIEFMIKRFGSDNSGFTSFWN